MPNLENKVGAEKRTTLLFYFFRILETVPLQRRETSWKFLWSWGKMDKNETKNQDFHTH